MEKTCCVTGHKDLPSEQMETVKAGLRREIEKAVADGYTEFMTGFSDGVEQCFVEIVAEMKKEYPKLRLTAVLPYQKRMDTLQARKRTKSLLDACSEITVIQEEYEPSVYSRRNRYMVKQSGRVIAVYDGREKGGTVKMIRLAHIMRKELREIPVEEIVLPRQPITRKK